MCKADDSHNKKNWSSFFSSVLLGDILPQDIERFFDI